MLQSSSLLPSVFLAATGLTGCLDLQADGATESMSCISEGISARQTTCIRLVANLDATDAISAFAFDVNDPSSGSNFGTTISIYDSLGAAHALGLYFRRTSANAFEYHVLVAGDELRPLSRASSVEVGSGLIHFDTDGTLLAVDVIQNASVVFVEGEEAQVITIDLGNGKSEGGLGTDGLTMYARPSNVSFQSQNGHAQGRFAGVDVRSKTEVYALYTNGSLIRMIGMNAAGMSAA